MIIVNGGCKMEDAGWKWWMQDGGGKCRMEMEVAGCKMEDVLSRWRMQYEDARCSMEDEGWRM